MKQARLISAFCMVLFFLIAPRISGACASAPPAPPPPRPPDDTSACIMLAQAQPAPADTPISASPDTPAAADGLVSTPESYIVRGSGKQVGRATASQEVLVTLSEDMVNVRATILYHLANAPAAELKLSVPKGYVVMDAQGPGIMLSRVDGGVLAVKLAKPVAGDYQLVVLMEKPRGAGAGDEALPELVSEGMARESGVVAVEVTPGLEATVRDVSQLSAIDPGELPYGLRGGAQPLLYSYRFTRHPYAATFGLAQYKQITTLNATIDAANLVSVLTPEGRLLTRAIYEVRNNRKQYLKLLLPAKAEVWSVYVNERPVVATTDGKGQFFLPLVLPGRATTDGTFTVEIIYFLTIDQLKKKGDLKTMFPRSDLPISEMLVSLYLPPKYAFDDFEGSLERIELDELPATIPADNQAPSPGAIRKMKNSAFALSRQSQMESEIADEARQNRNDGYWGRMKASEMPPAPAAYATAPAAPAAAAAPTPAPPPGYSTNYNADVDYDQQHFQHTAAAAPGALPVKFSVPLRGQLFRFTKLVVVDETPELTFNYKKSWKKAAWVGQAIKTGFWTLVAALAVALVLWIRRRPRRMKPVTLAVTPAEPAPPLDELVPAPTTTGT